MNVSLPDGAQALREQLLELLRAQALGGARIEVLLVATAGLTPAQAARALPVAARRGMQTSVADGGETLTFTGTAPEVAELLRAAAGLGGAG